MTKTLQKLGRKKHSDASKKRARSKETNEILGLLKLGKSGTEIAKTLGCKATRVYSIKRYYSDEIEIAKIANNTRDITNYDGEISKLLKSNILNINNAIINKDLSRASLSQLSGAFGTLFDKLRLLEGKSTQNIQSNVINNLNPEQISIIKDSIKSLKESMLNIEKD
jgi:hypothetical protein